MTRSSGARLLAASAALVLFDAGWLVRIALTRERDRDDGWAKATCGAGLGAAVTPDWSFADVDPRLSAGCDGELYPLPGLACPDPDHGTGVGAGIPSARR